MNIKKNYVLSSEYRRKNEEKEDEQDNRLCELIFANFMEKIFVGTVVLFIMVLFARCIVYWIWKV